jgi:very-short-patch-repair endonuclease
LAVEIDGESHGYAERARKDAARDAWLASQNIRVLRIPAVDILRRDGLDDVLLAIADAADQPIDKR